MSRLIAWDEHRIDAIFAGLNQCQLPGAAVGIAIGGRPVYRKAFGLASMELPLVLAPTMRMRIASVTKHFTALAYLLLCEEGKAGIDDEIGMYLPELHPVTHSVTLRQLMGHVSGLRDAHDICYQLSGAGHAVLSDALLSLYRDIDDVNAAPGTTWNYNNGGYLLLTAVIERITRQSLEQVLRERIFEPLAMHGTLLRRFDSDFLPNSATLHMTRAAGGFQKSYLGTAFAGEGGIVSTVDDMLRWLVHMNAPVVGSAASWQAMQTPQWLLNGTSTGYGLGLIVGRYRGVDTLSHVGSVLGGTSHLLKVPSAGLDIIVMANRHDVDSASLAYRILEATIDDLMPELPARSRRFATGTFLSPLSGRVIQLFAKEGEQIASVDGFELPMQPDENGVLRPVAVLSLIKQAVTLIGDPERPAAIRFSDFGNVDDFDAVEPTAQMAVDSIVGRYRSDQTRTEFRIVETREGLCLWSTGRFGVVEYRLERLAAGIWHALSTTGVPWWGGILSFDAGAAACRFTTARNRALPFRRVPGA